jgi:hypothetical protein
VPHGRDRQEAIEHGCRHGMAARKTIRGEDEERIVGSCTPTLRIMRSAQKPAKRL